MNILELYDFWENPIFCPFCGHKFSPENELGCTHLLYIVYEGRFMYASERFENLFGEECEFLFNWPRPTQDDIDKFGDRNNIIQKIESRFKNFTEFQIDEPMDTAFYGFTSTP